MGNSKSKSGVTAVRGQIGKKLAFEICAVTGDIKNAAETPKDSVVVRLVLHDETSGNTPPISLENLIRPDLVAGSQVSVFIIDYAQIISNAMGMLLPPSSGQVPSVLLGLDEGVREAGEHRGLARGRGGVGRERGVRVRAAAAAQRPDESGAVVLREDRRARPAEGRSRLGVLLLPDAALALPGKALLRAAPERRAPAVRRAQPDPLLEPGARRHRRRQRARAGDLREPPLVHLRAEGARPPRSGTLLAAFLAPLLFSPLIHVRCVLNCRPNSSQWKKSSPSACSSTPMANARS